ncbi:hypothetical protein Xen7305DRAFT_00025850 [Xenococcus sp. PCC 7305]|uniref:hypothetical protein n=1 Tax=Xenococcus sp. PCC 7305 TaxID=102125 RepID=UPI0002AC9DBC|nr:hypothetical protein [Xenococcus sp. PCC 7305]ELS02867.1 hypothetical protein Xen7305DRAFT_00025850 [Xenococcus sp. PCC 7305]
MKTLSYALATLAVISLSLLPANAVEEVVKNNAVTTDTTEQIKQSTQPGQGCCWVFFYGCLCG